MLVPVICASDTMHLTKFSSDKKTCSIYITIGNIKSTIRNKPSAKVLLLLALLPIAPKSTSTLLNDFTSIGNQHTIHKVLENIFRDLQHPGKKGVYLDCADGQKWPCFPVLYAW